MEPQHNSLIGTWGLESYTVSTPAGKNKNLWGENAEGMLIYQANGYMSVQVSDKTRPLFDNRDYLSGDADEIDAAFKGYTAYFGRYVVHPGNIIHHIVDQSLYPNWSGVTLIRYLTLNQNELVLSTPPIQMKDDIYTMKMNWYRI